jgi:hypothetical protein
VIFVVFITMNTLISAIWGVTFYIPLDVCPRFGGMYCLCLQEDTLKMDSVASKMIFI